MKLNSKKLTDIIIKQKDWIKLWDFYFSIWFLDRLIETHIKYQRRLGFENQNTLHLFKKGKEEAFFLKKEVEKLRRSRRNKLLSKKYIDNHYNDAKLAMAKMEDFFEKEKDLDIAKSFLLYSNILEELLSYYRASRPEIFEIIEEELKKSGINKNKKKYLKDLVLKYGKLRLDIKNSWLSAERKAEKIKNKLAKKLNINFNELEYLTTKEIENLLGKKISLLVAKKKVKERKSCIFGLIKGEKILITGENAKIIAEHLTPSIKQTRTILGKAAHPGVVIGKVRIIPQTNYKKMVLRAKQFKKREILVTGMTQPDIIIACKKAAAIITDEGGITSHAAIVSRELGIPCIIGTKIATKVLKDGDLVEVDAEKGIVKILKKNKKGQL